MRIEIAPELLAKRKADAQSRPQPRTPVSVPGGVDFQQLLQNIYDAVLITDMAGEISMVNLRANQFFFAEASQLASYNIMALICGAEAALLNTILETLEGNRFVLMQAHCLRLDGSTFPAEISANRLRLAGKQYLSFFIRDITLRKEREDQLRTGNTALQNASSGIVITGRNAEIEYFNPAFLPLIGLAESDDLQGHTLHEFLCQPGLVNEILASVASGQNWAGELEMLRSDGTTFFGQASVAANLNADGEQVGMVLSLLDITGQKRAQQQLQEYAQELNKRNAQLQEDLNIASELHQALLPSDFRLFPKGATENDALLRFSHLYSPSGSIGGDFFDIRKVSEQEVAFFIADVMGHGIRSALVVATLRGLLQELRPTQNDPGLLLQQLNANYSGIFKRLGGDVIFATAFYGVLDTRTGWLRYANASHPLPYLLKRSDSSLQRLVATGFSAALGLFGATAYKTHSVQMAPGDLVLLYTDGLSETENSLREAYEGHELEKFLKTSFQLPASDLLTRLTDDARRFSESGAFADDVCLLAVELLRTRE